MQNAKCKTAAHDFLALDNSPGKCLRACFQMMRPIRHFDFFLERFFFSFCIFHFAFL